MLAPPALSGKSSARSACSTAVSDIGTLHDPTHPIEFLLIHQTSMFRKNVLMWRFITICFRKCLYMLYDYWYSFRCCEFPVFATHFSKSNPVFGSNALHIWTPFILFVIVFQEISSGCSNYQSFIVIFPWAKIHTRMLIVGMRTIMLP
jgi:hypothetical protein